MKNAKMLTKKEVAERLNVSERTVNRLMTSGRLRKIKILGCIRFRMEDVDNLCEGV